MIPAPQQVSRPGRARGALPRALAVACLAALLAPEASASRVVDVRVGDHAGFSRVVIELDRSAGYRVVHDAARGIFTVTLEASANAETLASPSGAIESVAVEPGPQGTRASVRLRDRTVEVRERILSDPPRLVLDFHRARPEPPPAPRAAAPPPPVVQEPAAPPPREAELVSPEPVAEAEAVLPEPTPEAETPAPSAAVIAEPALPEVPEVEPAAPAPPPRTPAAVPPIQIARESSPGGWSAALAAFLATGGVALTILAFWRHRIRWPRRAAARKAAQAAEPVVPRGRPPRPAPRDAAGAGPRGPEGKREPLRKPPTAGEEASTGTTMAGMTRER